MGPIPSHIHRDTDVGCIVFSIDDREHVAGTLILYATGQITIDDDADSNLLVETSVEVLYQNGVLVDLDDDTLVSLLHDVLVEEHEKKTQGNALYHGPQLYIKSLAKRGI